MDLFLIKSIKKKKLQNKFFPVKIMKFIRTPILKNICERLLLDMTTIFYIN